MPTPGDREARRLEALARQNILDTKSEDLFDRFTAVASQVFSVPIAIVSLVADDRQWFKSCVGLDVEGTPRNVAFCDYAIRESCVTVVPDASADPRFANNPLVTGEPHIRFYAGAPLITPDGYKIGTLCIIDRTPRQSFGPSEAALLETLAAGVMSAITLRNEAQASHAMALVAADRQQLLVLAERMAHVGTWSWDVVSNTTTWSPEVYAIHGVDPSLPPPSLDGVIDLYMPDDGAQLMGLINRAMAEGLDYQLDATIIRPNGDIRNVIAHGTTRKNTDGTIEALMGTFQDVTALRLADRQTRDSEERFRLLADNTNDIVSESDLTGRFTYLSSAVDKVSGYSVEESLGRQALDFVHPDDRERVRIEIAEALASADGRRIEHRHVRKDGEVIWVESRPTLVLDPESQQPIAVRDVLRDVTERKNYEAALEVARDAALAATKAKSDFLSNMSHEIRTPLTSIIGFAGLLERMPDLPPAARTYSKRIVTGGNALLLVVNDILDLARIESGHIQIEKLAFDLRSLVVESVELVDAQASAKGLSVSVEWADDPPAAVIGDPARLRQILLNYLTNAIKFTPCGSITVSVHYDRDAGGKLRLLVSDTGIGISPDRVDALFERFEQADNSISRQYGGTGLGLAIVKQLAEMMGGSVGVESEVGSGSTFCVEVPTPSVDLIATPAEPADFPTWVEPFRILIVDDLAVNRELIRTILEPFDVKIHEAADGFDAIDIASRTRVDLILMDIQMPRMDGLEATRVIRGTAGPNCRTPIVALTAATLPAQLEASRLAGMNDHLAKPFDIKRMIDRIAFWTTRTTEVIEHPVIYVHSRTT